LESVALYRQDRIREKIEREISDDRLAPSIIFHGQPGLGKERMAFYLAQSVLCGSPGTGACGACLPCRKIERLIHPDVVWLYPRPGSAKDDELEMVIARKAKKDFYRPSFGKSVSHAIDGIRQLRAISGKRPYEGAVKIFIVTDADRMTVEAANAFLKLLEEPPDDTVIVMTTSRLHALLPTIRSRCVEVRFPALPLGRLREILAEELNLPPKKADSLARNSEGSLGRAVMLRDRKGKGGWEDAWRLFQLARLGSETDRYAFVVENSLKGDRDRLRMALDVLVSILRDRAVVDLGLGQDDVINIERFGDIEAAGTVPAGGFVRSVGLVEELIRLLDRNVNVSILLWRLLRDLSRNLRPV
jgi:DNA polymerase-3 subunit delta'